jgi:hypothetical protein
VLFASGFHYLSLGARQPAKQISTKLWSWLHLWWAVMEAPVKASPVTWSLSGKRDVESNFLYLRDIALNVSIQMCGLEIISIADMQLAGWEWWTCISWIYLTCYNVSPKALTDPTEYTYSASWKYGVVSTGQEISCRRFSSLFTRTLY